MFTCLHKSQFRVVALVIFFLSFISFLPPLNAQNTAGVGIKPAIINEKMDPGQVRQFSVSLTNLSTQDQRYYISKRDIAGVREGGAPIFIRDEREQTGYELTEWITLDKSELFLPAGASGQVDFVLQVPEFASPGSHFGGVIVSIEPPNLDTSGASVGYEVANIISIRISGEANDVARIREFSTERYIHGETNVEFTARIENEGNTLVIPTGPLEIHNMFGKKVAMLQLNEALGGIFPKTPQSDGLRSYNVVWQDDGVGFGRYEAILSVVYGDEGRKNTISSTVSFWILPMNIIWPALAVLLVILILVYVFVRLYVRRSLAALAVGSSRRLIRTRQSNNFPVLLLFVTMLTVTALFLIVLLLLFA